MAAAAAPMVPPIFLFTWLVPGISCMHVLHTPRVSVVVESGSPQNPKYFFVHSTIYRYGSKRNRNAVDGRTQQQAPRSAPAGTGMG